MMAYTTPNDPSYAPIQYMVCANCKKPSLEEFWDAFDVPDGMLMCPNCCEDVPITEWIAGVPPQPEEQICLMCGGEGKIK